MLSVLALLISLVVFSMGTVISFFLLVGTNDLSDHQALPVLVLYIVAVGLGAFGLSFGSTLLLARLFPKEAHLGLRQPLACSLGAAGLLTVLSTIVLAF